MGRRVVGEPEQRARPWGTVFRLTTDDGGVVWSKANGPGPAHESAVLAVLVARDERLVQSPLAIDAARSWILTDDGGPTLRNRVGPDGRPADQDLATWERLLPAFAGLQRRTEGDIGDLLAAGVPDERAARYPAILDAILDDDAPWDRADAVDRDRTDAARGRLVALRPRIVGLAAELTASPVASSVDHGDLHGNNVLGDAIDGWRVFDWGDAVVAHPFAVLTTALGSFTYHAGLSLDGPELARLRDAYTEAWTDRAPRAALARTAMLALDLASIGKAAAWERALQGLEPADMGGFHGATAAWLADAVERLERW